AGIQRILGTKAAATLTVTITQLLGSTFTLPAGYEVTDKAGLYTFRTDANLLITPGNISGTVTATAADVGPGFNVAAYSINRLSQPLAYLQSITNTEAASGGTAGETMEQTKARAFAAIRRRGLVSADDYEEETRALLGAGSVAKAIGNLAADATTIRRGSVHVFALNPNAASLNTAQITSLQAALQAKTHVAVAVYVSNVNLVLVEISVIAKLVPGSNPQTTADLINTRLMDYLTPGALPLGETLILKELEYQARLAGVDYVQSVAIAPVDEPLAATNLPLPYAYSAAQLNSLTVELVDGSQVYAYTYGQGDPD
ncbi:MAG TPA: baseplate J/gp47 family protein, partial [Trichocoleus sp.]